VGIHAHSAELVDNKNSTVHTHALLCVKDRSLRVKLYQQRNQKPEGRKQRKCKCRDKNVRDALGSAREVGEWLAKQPDHWQGANLVDLGFTRQTIEQAGGNTKLDSTTPATTHHHVKQRVCVNLRVGDDYFVGARVADSFRQSRKIAHYGHAF